MTVPNPADDVIVAPNGELFLAGGRHSVLRFARGEATVAPRVIDTMRTNLEGRRAHAAQRGTPYLHLVAPEKYKVFPEGFPVDAPCSPADAHLAAGIGFTYPVEELRAAQGPGRSYYRTDTHWAPAGLVVVAGLIAKGAGRSPEAVEAARQAMVAAMVEGEDVFYGDLGRKIEPKIGETRHILKCAHPVKTTENGLGHDYLRPVNDGRMIITESGCPQAEGRLLIFGDSYLHHALPYLTYVFKTIVFCRTRFYHTEMVGMTEPDMIVTQAADRYLGTVASDADAPPFHMIPFLLGRTPQTTPEDARVISTALSGGRTLDFAAFPLPKPAA